MPRISRLDRRSFLGRVLGTVAAGGAIALIAGRAKAQTYTGVTDADLTPVRDRPGYGTGTRTQYTDQDTGPNRDAQFHGRGPQGATSGSGSYGTAPSGCSDSDGGEGADPGGRGVRCNGQTPPTHYPPAATRHCTDSDGGNSADPVGQGRNC
ncbi:MAG: hypothetical protein H7X93_10200 [Sphingomonadaceae bacterium]|nr:hypothetical protein [Sphingomonadaceae bacterium]